MPIFREKVKVKKGDFWDGTVEGFAKLPAEIQEWCAIVKGNLIYCDNSPPAIGMFTTNAPCWLFVDPVRGVSLLAPEEVEKNLDEIDDDGNVKPKPIPDPIVVTPDPIVVDPLDVKIKRV